MTTCAATQCICCVCILRRSDDFRDAFTPSDSCCDACHADMAARDWPGSRCTPAAEKPAPPPNEHAEQARKALAKESA